MCVGPSKDRLGIPGIECDHTFLRWQQPPNRKFASGSRVNSRSQSPLQERHRTGLSREQISLWLAGYPKTPGFDLLFGSYSTEIVRPRLVHVRFNSDSDRQPSKRDPALRAMTRHHVAAQTRSEVCHGCPRDLVVTVLGRARSSLQSSPVLSACSLGRFFVRFTLPQHDVFVSISGKNPCQSLSCVDRRLVWHRNLAKGG